MTKNFLRTYTRYLEEIQRKMCFELLIRQNHFFLFLFPNKRMYKHLIVKFFFFLHSIPGQIHRRNPHI